LLVGGLHGLGRFLRAQAARTSDRPLAFVHGLIEHVDEQRRLARAMVGKRSGQVMQQRFRQLLVDLVREDLEPLAPAGPGLDAAVRYVAGALFEVLIWWLDVRTQLTAAQLEQRFHELTTPVLEVLRTSKSRRT
jgi:hypothetical protein